MGSNVVKATQEEVSGDFATLKSLVLAPCSNTGLYVAGKEGLDPRTTLICTAFDAIIGHKLPEGCEVICIEDSSLEGYGNVMDMLGLADMVGFNLADVRYV